MSSVFKYRLPGVYDSDAASAEAVCECKDESLAQQSFGDEVDINTLVRRFGLTGTVPVLDRMVVASDFDEVFDYQSAMNLIVQADRAFMSLPADVRSRFGNSPAAFVEFCSVKDNLPELRRLGLAPAIEEPAAASPPVVGDRGEPPVSGDSEPQAVR